MKKLLNLQIIQNINSSIMFIYLVAICSKTFTEKNFSTFGFDLLVRCNYFSNYLYRPLDLYCPYLSGNGKWTSISPPLDLIFCISPNFSSLNGVVTRINFSTLFLFFDILCWKGVFYLMVMLIFLLSFCVIPIHYLLYRFASKRFHKLNFFLKLNLTAILSSILFMMFLNLALVLPTSLQGSYDSAGGDLTILPVLIIFIGSILFLLLYIVVLNVVMTIRRNRKNWILKRI